MLFIFFNIEVFFFIISYLELLLIDVLNSVKLFFYYGKFIYYKYLVVYWLKE